MSPLNEGARFVAVGLVQILLDSGVYIALTSLGAPTPPANFCGRIAGATLGFWLNGKVTFVERQQPRLAARFTRYAALWVTMTIVSTTLLTIIARDGGLVHAWWSKPLVECTLGLVSFLVSRYWVYHRNPTPRRGDKESQD